MKGRLRWFEDVELKGDSIDPGLTGKWRVSIVQFEHGVCGSGVLLPGEQ